MLYVFLLLDYLKRKCILVVVTLIEKGRNARKVRSLLA